MYIYILNIFQIYVNCISKVTTWSCYGAMHMVANSQPYSGFLNPIMNFVVHINPTSNHMHDANTIVCYDHRNTVGSQLEYSWNIPTVFQLYSNCIPEVTTFNCSGTIHIV
jgi:hypothetical protein